MIRTRSPGFTSDMCLMRLDPRSPIFPRTPTLIIFLIFVFFCFFLFSIPFCVPVSTTPNGAFSSSYKCCCCSTRSFEGKIKIKPWLFYCVFIFLVHGFTCSARSPRRSSVKKKFRERGGEVADLYSSMEFFFFLKKRKG